jgi:hypothetical protein
MSDAMEAVLRLRGPDQDMIEEAEFGARGKDVAAALAAADGPYGMLVLRGGGQAEIVLPDDLLPLASALTDGLTRLRSGDGAEIGSYGEPFEWRLERRGAHIETRATRPGEPPEPEPEDGESVDISGAVLDSSAYAPREEKREDDAAALIGALAGAAERLLNLLGGKKLEPEDADLLAGARDALAGKPPPPRPPGGPLG